MLFFCLLFRVSFSFGLSLVRIYSFLGQAWAGELAMSRLARTADGKPGENVRSHDLYRSHASMNKQKKSLVCQNKLRAIASKHGDSKRDVDGLLHMYSAFVYILGASQ